MANPTQEDLDNLNKDIANAQNTLNDINYAINRDQLQREEKSHDIDSLLTEESTIIERIQKLKTEEEQVIQERKLSSVKNAEIIVNQENDIKQLQNEITWLKAEKTEAEEEKSKAVTILQEAIAELEAMFNKKRDEMNKDLDVINKDIEAKKTEQLEIAQKNESLSSIREQLISSIKFLEEKETLANKTIDELSKNIIKNNDILLQISKNTTDLTTSQQEKKRAEDELINVNNLLEESKKELETNKEDIQTFVKH